MSKVLRLQLRQKNTELRLKQLMALRKKYKTLEESDVWIQRQGPYALHQILKELIASNVAMKTRLLATGHSTLIFCSQYDRILGNGLEFESILHDAMTEWGG